MDMEDTTACSDTKPAAKPEVFLDMDLLQHRSIDEMDSAVMSLSGEPSCVCVCVCIRMHAKHGTFVAVVAV
jgi:hypothetical protein